MGLLWNEFYELTPEYSKTNLASIVDLLLIVHFI